MTSQARAPIPDPYSRTTKGLDGPGVPALRNLPRQGDAEERVSLGCGQEVAGASRSAHRRDVVPPCRMIERQLHEPREGDAATGGVNLGADDGDEIRLVGVESGIGIECAGGGVRAMRAIVEGRRPEEERECPV